MPEMWVLFDMGNMRILHTSPDPSKLRFEEDEWPKHLSNVWSTRVESIEDPLFLGVLKCWSEINLRRLYTWMKIAPPLTPTKMNDAAFIDIRMKIRATIAFQLRLEPSKLPILEAYAGPVSAPPKPPRIPVLPPAQRGSVGPLIHRVATEMWEAAGSPRDVPVILALRQIIMKTLNDEHKIKISTSSNELGRWQKQLLTS
jgi:hypothetical protein